MSFPRKEKPGVSALMGAIAPCYSVIPNCSSNLNKIKPLPAEDLGLPCPPNTGLTTPSTAEHLCLVDQLQHICLYDSRSLSLAHASIAPDPASLFSIIKTHLIASVKFVALYVYPNTITLPKTKIKGF